jgi:hypothetical protein
MTRLRLPVGAPSRQGAPMGAIVFPDGGER